MNIPSYYEGCKDALRWYAIMRGGVYYVGSCGKTLKEAIKEVEDAERDGRLYGMRGL